MPHPTLLPLPKPYARALSPSDSPLRPSPFRLIDLFSRFWPAAPDSPSLTLTLCSFARRHSPLRPVLPSVCSSLSHPACYTVSRCQLEKGAVMEEHPNFFPMSVERSFEAWEEKQRHDHDFADRLAQDFNGLLHSHMSPPFPRSNHQKLFDADFSSAKRSSVVMGDKLGMNGVSAIFDIGNRLGQAGAEFRAALNGVVQ